MRVTSKVHVTITQLIRQQAGLHPNSEVRFLLVGGQVVLEKVDGQAQQRGEKAIARMGSHRPRTCLSTEAILALCRSEGC